MRWTPWNCMKLTFVKELGRRHWYSRLFLSEKARPMITLVWKPLKKITKFTGMLKIDASGLIEPPTTSNWKPAYFKRCHDWVVFSHVPPPTLKCLMHLHSPPKEHSLPGGKSKVVSCKQAGPTWSFILAGEASSMTAKSPSNAAALRYEGCTMTEEILMSCSWPSVCSKWCSPSRTYQ